MQQDVERVAADMAAFGFPEAAITQMRAEAGKVEEDEGLAVHPDNETAVRLLQATRTQWRTVALSTAEKAQIRRTGIDYGVLTQTARLAGLGRIRADDFTRLRILEAECLNAWAEDAQK